MSENSANTAEPPGSQETANSREANPANAQGEGAAKAGGTSPRVVFYMLLPVLLLGASAVGWLVMVSIAVDDPGFAVEPNYYKKAAGYDAQIAQREQNTRLGWKGELVEFSRSGKSDARLVVRLSDAADQPLRGVTVEAHAFAIARAAEISTIALSEGDDGLYEAILPRARPGLWEVRLRASLGEVVFTKALRPEMTRGVGP